MPAEKVFIDNKVRKAVLKLPASVQDHFTRVLFTIKMNPLVGIKLHGDLKGYYKLRIGDYRIIYEFDQKSKTVTILKIEHRQGIYK